MIKKYIKVTPIEAIQVTPNNHAKVREFAKEHYIEFGVSGLWHEMDTFESVMEFNDFDYLVRNQTGECYVCDKDIFESTYKEVEE